MHQSVTITIFSFVFENIGWSKTTAIACNIYKSIDGSLRTMYYHITFLLSFVVACAAKALAWTQCLLGNLNIGQFAWTELLYSCTTVSPTASYSYLYKAQKTLMFGPVLSFCFRHVAVLTPDNFSSFVALVTWSCFF